MTEKHTRTSLTGPQASQTPAVALQTPGLTARMVAVTATLASMAILLLVPATAGAQTPAQPRYPVPGAGFPSAPQLQLPQMPQRPAITANGTVIEDVIARINDQIITRSEYERARLQMLQDAEQQKADESALQDHLKDLLRDMIDSDLLISKGKELGISCDAETVRQLDDIRKQNHLPDMEALEKAAAQQGVSFEDFKQNIRNQCIRQSVVREEVGRRLQPTHAQEEAYYQAHAKEFEVPEQIHLSEILIPTPENATDAQIAQAQAKADEVVAKLKAGANFADLAKVSSGGPTASAGGDLGDFKRGALGSQLLEDATFPLAVGANTAPIRTRQGFVVLKVDAHQAAGVPPMAQVEDQLQQAIYMDQLQPALRAYLTKARGEAYMEIAPGFVDTGSATKTNNSNFAYTAYSAPAVKKKIQNKQRAEQERAAKAQAALAAARARVAEKQQAKAEADKEKLSGGKRDVSGKQPKRKRIPREKIRYGQAPRNSLPTATTVTATEAGAPLAGQAAGVAMAPTESITSITTGTGAEPESTSDNADALAPVEGQTKKTRFSGTQTKAEVDRANAKLSKAETKATIRPVAATHEATADEKARSGPLGLNGDQVKKVKKKKVKDAPKSRLQAQPEKPVEKAAPIAPTVNPLVTGGSTTSAPKKDAPSSDNTTLPSAAPTAPGASPAGQPIPAATSAEPNQPATTPAPH
ncbi:peptidylprolyl isomerase [Granulicella paludicola]|uniref:peptidylprolyl isomerase n=1 Tax=Granulicella paludicola TaxID=474951 RepID=UPI0021DFC93F|nr:peptidylprolyl isomerase [Granulicella paludicola]